MRDRLERERWTSGHGIVVHADHGRLVLWGMVVTEAEKSALETMARAIPGVKAVETHLAVRSSVPYHYGI